MDVVDRAQAAQEAFLAAAFRAVPPRAPVTQAAVSSCMSCGAAIDAGRLTALPGCCLCIDCQQDFERVCR